MAIPHENFITDELLRLLSNAPNGKMDCGRVYAELAERFPEVTPDERDRRYRNSLSKRANRVQFARLRCVLRGLIVRPRNSRDRGTWTVTDEGRSYTGKVS